LDLAQSIFVDSFGMLASAADGTIFELALPKGYSTTTTSLTVSPATSNYGQPVTMTATVTAADGKTPTGGVQFYFTDASGTKVLTGVDPQQHAACE
jgi:hypothetical protein